MPHRRVAARWLLAALGDNLTPALAKYEATGDYEGLREAIDHAMDEMGVKPKGGRPDADWVHALGPKQRNALPQIVAKAIQILGWLRPREHPIPFVTQDVKELQKGLRWVARLSEKGDKPIKRGPFNVFPLPGVTQATAERAMQALDTAAALLAKNGLRKVLYGKVFITPALAGVSKGGQTVALYVSTKDVVYLSTKAEKTLGSVWALIHELGHRYYARFWDDKKARRQFHDFSTSTQYGTRTFDRPTLYKEYLRVLEAERDPSKPKPGVSKDLTDYIYQMTLKPGVLSVLRGVAQEVATEARSRGSSNPQGVVPGERTLRGARPKQGPLKTSPCDPLRGQESRRELLRRTGSLHPEGPPPARCNAPPLRGIALT